MFIYASKFTIVLSLAWEPRYAASRIPHNVVKLEILFWWPLTTNLLNPLYIAIVTAIVENSLGESQYLS